MKQGVGYKISQKAGLLHSRMRLLAKHADDSVASTKCLCSQPRISRDCHRLVSHQKLPTPQRQYAGAQKNCPEHAVTAPPFLIRPWLRFRQFPDPGFHLLTETFGHFGIVLNKIIPFARITEHIKEQIPIFPAVLSSQL